MGNTRIEYEMMWIEITKSKDGLLAWRIDLGIKRIWPLSWLDHRPWESFCRRHYPVKTFIGSGDCWYELRGDKAFGAGRYVAVLNAIVSEEALVMLRHN